MAQLGDASKRKLSTCELDLQTIVQEAVKVCDLAVVYGHRTDVEQEELYTAGKSKLTAGNSKHNIFPSHAVDVAPYPIDWSETGLAHARFYFLAGVMMTIAQRLGIKLRWGGDWNGNGVFSDQTFHDLGHFELVGD